MISATRRAVLATGTLGLLGMAAPLPSAPLLRVPEVDSLDLHIVTDNALFGPFLDDLTLPGLRVTRRGHGPARAGRLDPRTLLAEFGLSILASSRLGTQERRVLVDFGYSAPVLANNLDLLGLDPRGVNAAVLSHGHLDHYGGFAGLFGANRPATVLPLLVGGEEAFCERTAMVGDPPPIMGTLDRAALAAAGLDVRIRPTPVLVADHGFTTGTIPLTGFERAAIPTRMRPGVGCDARALAPSKRAAADLPDDGEHELATCYAVRGLGLVVIASCSHRGVLNSIRRAQAVSGISRVHAVIGGFHLVRPRTPDEARRTVAELAIIDPAYVIPMHCTGETFIAEALRVMPRKVIRPYVGNIFRFAA